MLSGVPGPLGKALADLVDQCQTLCEDNKRLHAIIADKAPNSKQVWHSESIAASPLPNSVNVGLDSAADMVDHNHLLIPNTCQPPATRIESDLCRQGIPATIDHLHNAITSAGEVSSKTGTAAVKSWKEHTDLHPLCAAFDYGAKTLASSRIGMLKKPVTAADAAAGPSPMMALWDLMKTTYSSDQTFISRFASSLPFKLASVAAIIMNAIYIGIRANVQVVDSYLHLFGSAQPTDWLGPDIAFIVWFAFELICRALDERALFLTGESCRWNAFDAVLVISSVLDLVLEGNSSVAFLRILRVFRLLRFGRVVRAVKFLHSLRTMIYAVVNSFVMLLWALLMISIVMYVFAIIFSGAVTGHFGNIDPSNIDEMKKAKEIHEHFGSMFKCMVSLFCAISGGNDWYMYAEPLKELGGGNLYFLIFIFYIAVVTIGILNVVTGIFVDSAVCTRTEDEVVQHWREDQQRTSEEVKRIFVAADTDCSGSITLEELMMRLEDPWVKAYFSGLDVDPSEAKIIFTLMDADHNGTVVIDEFVAGIMKLRGTAKSVDIMAMLFDQAIFAVKFNKLCSYVEDTMRELKDEITPGTEPTPRIFQTLEHSMAQHSAFEQGVLVDKQSLWREGMDGPPEPAGSPPVWEDLQAVVAGLK